MDLFPNIGLEKSKLWDKGMTPSSPPSSILFFMFYFLLFLISFQDIFLISFSALWYDRSYRRKYLEHVAKTHGFDPLVATNWYSFPREKFIQVKVRKIKRRKGGKGDKKKGKWSRIFMFVN